MESDFLDQLMQVSLVKPMSEWTNEELYASVRRHGFTPCLSFVKMVNLEQKVEPFVGDLLAMTHEINRRVKTRASIGPDAYMRAQREVVITPGRVVMGEEEQQMHLGMCVQTQTEAVALSAAAVLLTGSCAKMVDSRPMIVATTKGIYPEASLIREGTGVKLIDQMATDMLSTAADIGLQQLKVGERMLKAAQEQKLPPIQVVSAVLYKWPSDKPYYTVMRAPEVRTGLMAKMTKVYHPAPVPGAPKTAKGQLDLIRMLKMHGDARGHAKGKLSALLQGCYLGDVGTCTKMVTEAMALEAVLAYVSKALFSSDETPFYSLEGYGEDLRDQLSKSMAIYRPEGDDYDENPTPGRRSGRSYRTVYQYEVAVPSISSKGLLSTDVAKLIDRLKMMHKSNYIVEVFGYQEVFEQFPNQILLHPMGHKGTVFVVPLTLEMSYAEHARHVEYCTVWKTLFPYHRTPMWKGYNAGYSFRPIKFSSKRRMDVAALAFDVDVVEEQSDYSHTVDDFEYDRLESDNPLPDPVAKILNFDGQGDFQVEEPVELDLSELFGAETGIVEKPAPSLKKKSKPDQRAADNSNAAPHPSPTPLPESTIPRKRDKGTEGRGGGVERGRRGR